MGYTKYHVPWGAGDSLSGAALNHIESQWDYIKSDADLHEHNSRYYTKASADATFFALTTSVALGFDCDLLDGQHYSDLLAAVMPLGAIMIWSGTDATIPTGWHICDGGTYGGIVTPDLRDRFVLGGGGAYSPGGTMGPATWDGTITCVGTVTVGSHTLTTAELPAHTHTYEDHIRYGSSALTNDYSFPGYIHAVAGYSDGTTTIGEQSTGGGSHGHSGSTISFNGIDPRPPYYSLYYILKHA